jgi:hypothetical protein
LIEEYQPDFASLRMTLFVTIPDRTRHFQAGSPSDLCFPTAPDRPAPVTGVAQFARMPLCISAAITAVEDCRSSAVLQTEDGEVRSFPFSDFDPVFTRAPVRGISVALRHSVFCFAARPAGSGSSQNKSAQTAKNAERISFGSLRKSSPSALGSRAHSRGFAMCAPSKFGSSRMENKTCI